MSTRVKAGESPSSSPPSSELLPERCDVRGAQARGAK